MVSGALVALTSAFALLDHSDTLIEEASRMVHTPGEFASIQQQPHLATEQRVGQSPTPSRTGMPDALRAGIESLSGMSMDDVRVHYNSSKPAALQAHAYAQGTNIHVAPGQEQHLAHEAWHVVQQTGGFTRPG